MRLACVVCVVVLATGCGDRAAERAAKAEALAKADAAAEAERAAVAAEREAARQAALWTYSDVPSGKARQVAAMIKSANDVDADGKGGRSVLFVFRDHTAWGRSSYLVLSAGDFRCRPKCTVPVRVDDSPPVAMAAHEPRTDEATALFIDDWRALWAATRGAKQLHIDFPIALGGTRTVTFDIGGLDRSKMPGWDSAAAGPSATR